MPYTTIPTYNLDKDEWSETTFDTGLDLYNYLFSIFKVPGKYDFDETSFEFNRQGRIWNRDKVYCVAPFRSKDFMTYWDFEKLKCTKGVIYIHGENQWYLTREYYMWLNFMPIYNKDIKRFKFPGVRDVQYHMALYEDLAVLHNEHAAILKKRQIASSYFHAAKLVNRFWFDEGFVGKMAGSLKDYINEKGTWRFMEEYRNFLNSNTAWYRPCTPDKVLNWEQKIEINQGGRKRDVGLKSVIMGYALDLNPTNGVGGACDIFFHEEAGIAEKMDETAEYLFPALKDGMKYTGLFIAAGSVGDLEKCIPLQDMILNPAAKDIYAVWTDLVNDQGEEGMYGLFIPEQWSMQPFIDEYGNSDTVGALAAILAERIQWKKDLRPEDYQIRISQKPINIEEAFAYRKVSVFPLHLIAKQIKRLEDKEYALEYVDLSRDEQDKIVIKPSRKVPISEFPLSAKTVDKEGVVVIHERPIEGAPFGTYISSIDPVGEGKTTTSASLCSIYVYKCPLEVSKIKNDGTVETYLEPDKLVAWWCGRFDDINKTHQRLEMLIELYNAPAVIENNVSLFIQYMIGRHKQRFMVTKTEMVFLKDVGANKNVFQEYGWKNTGTLFKTNMMSYGIEFLNEEIDVETKADGEIVLIKHGVERITDIMLLKEMKAYKVGLNVDRIIAFIALVSYFRVLIASRGVNHKVERETKLEKSPKISNLILPSPFRHMGKSGGGTSRIRRSPFKNYK
jgi:hypothetical protein